MIRIFSAAIFAQFVIGSEDIQEQQIDPELLEDLESQFNETEIEDVIVPDDDTGDLSLVKTLDEFELDILNKKVEIMKSRLLKLEEAK
jgi:hypothetical protein